MLINIPNQALLNRIIPKDRFNFKNAKRIERIRWIGKLSTSTINLPSKKVIEIEIFSIDMPDFDKDVIRKILDKIPQVILFIINDTIVAMQYNNQIFLKKKHHCIQIKGFSIDEVRDNFLRQLIGIADASSSLDYQIDKVNKINSLLEKIKNVNNKIKRTPQINKKQFLARKRHLYEKKIAELKGEYR